MPRAKTNEEFHEEVKLVNPDIEVTGFYVNGDSKMNCKCKICGYEWTSTARNLIKPKKCLGCMHSERIFEYPDITHEEFCEIVKEKDIPVVQVIAGDVIKVEKGVQIKILFPADELIQENILNNNSLVAKLEYKEFKMLFTGDVEQIAEEKILNKYTDILESTILKVAHHGSKTSTIKGFVQAVKPQIALIGVGVNNKFGHPNNDVIKRLERVRC